MSGFLTDFARGGAPARSLALFRALFGLLMLILVGRYFAYGWIDAYFIRPDFHFKYYGFGWVRPWPPAGMYAHFALMGLAALFVMLGLFYRAAIITFTVLFSYFFLLDVTIYLNHYYLVCLVAFLLCFLPAHASWSLDATWRPALRRRHVPALYLNLLKLQFALVYFFGGIAKLNGDWLLRAQPLRIWLAGRTDLFLIGPALSIPATSYAFSWAGMLFDLCIPFLLWNRRTRNGAFVLLVIFHLLTRMLFPIGMFPWIMIAGAVLFVSDQWFGGDGTDASPAGNVSVARKPSRIAQGAAALYVVLQVLIPLRFALYPGDVRWTEQGFRFAWRVMAMQKSGVAEFTAAGRRIAPREYLTPFQDRQMSTQPDLILQFAHYLGDRFGGPVTARVRVSMNGRRNRPLINSERDLMKERDGFRAKTWIIPFHSSDGPAPRGCAGAGREGSARRPGPRNAACP